MNEAAPVMEGADIHEAKDALQNGDVGPNGWYLEDAAEILTRISTFLELQTGSGEKKALEFVLPTHPPARAAHEVAIPALEPEEWVGSPAQVQDAINAGSARPLGWYLHDLGEFLRSLAVAFNPPTDSKDWQLEFVRRGRGRRSQRITIEKQLEELVLLRDLRKKTEQAGKQDSAIADLMQKRGISRATIFRKKRAARESQ